MGNRMAQQTTDDQTNRVKSPTKKYRITCSKGLIGDINEMILSDGEYANISDYSVAAARFLLNDMYTVFIPALWDKLKSMGYREGDNIILAKKMKIKSGYDNDNESFQVTIPIGLLKTYNEVVFSIYNAVDVPELIRFAMEYYFLVVRNRADYGSRFLAAYLDRSELPPIRNYKPIIDFED